MKENTIEELAYFIKEANKAGQPQPIFFLGYLISTPLLKYISSHF